MITRKSLIIIFLVAAIIAAGFPVFYGHESAQKSGAGLIDVVRTIAQFSGSAQNPENFGHSLKKAMTTIYTAAGLITVIKSHSPKASQGVQVLDSTFLLAQTCQPFVANNYFDICEDNANAFGTCN